MTFEQSCPTCGHSLSGVVPSGREGKWDIHAFGRAPQQNQGPIHPWIFASTNMHKYPQIQIFANTNLHIRVRICENFAGRQLQIQSSAVIRKESAVIRKEGQAEEVEN